MTQMRLYPRAESLTPSESIFIMDVGTDGAPDTKSIAGDDAISSLVAAIGADGIDVTPTGDADADLITVGVTGAPKISWDESANAFTVSHRIDVGGTDGGTNSTDPVINVNRSVAGTGTNGHCFSDSSDVDRAGGVAYNSFDARITVGGSEDYDHFASFQSSPVIATSGTVDINYGFVDIPVLNSGTITDRYGIYCYNPTGAGTITNNYGIFVPEQTKGSTKNLAICTAGATTHSAFEGSITVGSQDQANGTASIVVNPDKAIATHYGVKVSATNTGNSVGFDASNECDGTGTVALVIGVYNRPVFSGIGTVTDFYSQYNGPTIGGAVTDYFGSYFHPPAGAGAITNGYGIYIADASARYTNDWAIYTAGVSPSYFGGPIHQAPGSSVTPANNGDLVVEATNNTTLTFKLKGSDGTVRTGTLELS